MQIQINTDHNIQGTEKLAEHVRGVVEHALEHFTDRVTRVEVHLSRESGDHSSQNALRCLIEARLEGRQPTAVTHQAESLDRAIDGAVTRLKHALESTLDRLDQHRR